MELTWIVGRSPTALHVAEAIWQGLELPDPRWEELSESLLPLDAALESLGAQRAPFWRHLQSSVVGNENARSAVEIAVRKTTGETQTTFVDQATGPLQSWLQVIAARFPQLADELALRIQPLRQLFQARGPGFAKYAAAMMDDGMLADSARIAAVQPVWGGRGTALPETNLVYLEAVLTDADPRVPELLRLGWLLLQLNLDLPRFSEAIPRPRLRRVARLATLPVAHRAAQQVEMIGPDVTCHQLGNRWLTGSDRTASTLDCVGDWWETFQAEPTDWPVALRGLDAMLLASSEG